MILSEIINPIKYILSKHTEIAFAYIHGSILDSERPGDLDIALFLHVQLYEKLSERGELSIGFAIPLEMEMEKGLNMKTDIQILNEAPLSFRHRVVKQGLLVIDNAVNLRCHFEYLSRYEYFDFLTRRKEYLQEVIS